MGFISALWDATRLRAATPENPRFSLRDPDAWDSLLNGPAASSGVRITTDSALGYSPWWRGINLIASSVGKVPLAIYRRDRLGLEPDRKHAGYSLLRRKPNQWQTAYEFRHQLTTHALSAGNGYAYIVRDANAAPLELLPLDPHKCSPVKEKGSGRVWYVLQVENGEPRKLDHDDVLHIHGPSWDGLMGLAVVEKAKESIGLGLASQKYQSIIYKNAGRPSVVLQVPTKVPDPVKKTIAHDWERMHAGLDNAHRTAILDMGMTANPLSFSADDAQLIQSRTFDLVDIGNWLGVHASYLGHQGATGYAGLEQISQGLLDNTLEAWLCPWEEECWDKLLTEEQKANESHECQFDRSALIRSDRSAQAAYWFRATGRPWATTNEARAALGMNADTDPESDKIASPLNMGDPGGEQKTEPSPIPKPKPPSPAQTIPPGKKDKGAKAETPKIRACGGEGGTPGPCPGERVGTPAELREERKKEDEETKERRLDEDSERDHRQEEEFAELDRREAAREKEYKEEQQIEDRRNREDERNDREREQFADKDDPAKRAALEEREAQQTKERAKEDAMIEKRETERQKDKAEEDRLHEKHERENKEVEQRRDKEDEAEERRRAREDREQRRKGKSARDNTPAIRAALEDAARRVVRRIALHARRTSKEPNAFVAFVDGFRLDHHAACCQMLIPACGLASAPAPLEADYLLDALHTMLSICAETLSAKALPAGVDEKMTVAEDTFPAAFAAKLCPATEDEPCTTT